MLGLEDGQKRLEHPRAALVFEGRTRERGGDDYLWLVSSLPAVFGQGMHQLGNIHPDLIALRSQQGDGGVAFHLNGLSQPAKDVTQSLKFNMAPRACDADGIGHDYDAVGSLKKGETLRSIGAVYQSICPFAGQVCEQKIEALIQCIRQCEVE
jgi:hypothetical protein